MDARNGEDLSRTRKQRPRKQSLCSPTFRPSAPKLFEHLQRFDPKTQTNLLGLMTSRKSTARFHRLTQNPNDDPNGVGDCKDLTQKSKFKVESNPFGSAGPKRKSAILARRRRFASILRKLMFLQIQLRHRPVSCHSLRFLHPSRGR
jgi:hypothetical protein